MHAIQQLSNFEVYCQHGFGTETVITDSMHHYAPLHICPREYFTHAQIDYHVFSIRCHP